MIKCSKCGSIYSQIQNQKCPTGCDIKIDLSPQDTTATNSRFIPFYKNKIFCFMTLLVVIVPILILLLSTTLSQLSCENYDFEDCKPQTWDGEFTGTGTGQWKLAPGKNI